MHSRPSPTNRQRCCQVCLKPACGPRGLHRDCSSSEPERIPPALPGTKFPGKDGLCECAIFLWNHPPRYLECRSLANSSRGRRVILKGGRSRRFSESRQRGRRERGRALTGIMATAAHYPSESTPARKTGPQRRCKAGFIGLLLAGFSPSVGRDNNLQLAVKWDVDVRV